jgi:hypothetical protein
MLRLLSPHLRRNRSGQGLFSMLGQHIVSLEVDIPLLRLGSGSAGRCLWVMTALLEEEPMRAVTGCGLLQGKLRK